MSVNYRNRDKSLTLVANIGSGGGGGSVDQVQADWSTTNTSHPSFIKNKPDLDEYLKKDDLDIVPPSSPTDPTQAQQLQADWTETNAEKVSFIKNKPDLSVYRLSADSYTKTEVNNLIGAIDKLDYKVVATLPTTDISSSTIYLVPNSASGNNVYDEYLYINNKWEIIGSTQVDLSDYYTKDEIDDTFDSYVLKTGDTMTGTLYMNLNNNTNRHTLNGDGLTLRKYNTSGSQIQNSDFYTNSIRYQYNEADNTVSSFNAVGTDLYMKNHDVIFFSVSPTTAQYKTGDTTIDILSSGAVTTTRTNFTSNQEFITKKYVDDNIPDVSGFITADDIPAQEQADWNETTATSKAYIKNKPNLDDYLPVAGGALTGQVTTNQTSFTQDQQLVTKKYVEDYVGEHGGITSIDWDDITNKPDITDTEVNTINLNTTTINEEGDVYYVTNEGDAHFHTLTVENIYDVNGNDITPVQSNWNETDDTSLAYIVNKPDLSIYVTKDEINIDTPDPEDPDAPTVIEQLQSNWEETNDTSVQFIQNKPDLSNMATTGATGNTYTKTEITEIINEATSTSYQIVDSLPATGENGIIYLVAVDDTDPDLGYEQWIYSNEEWINLGSTTVKLDNYYTKTQTDNKFVSKANLTDGSITEIDIGNKASDSDTSIAITKSSIVARGTDTKGVSASGFETVSTKNLDVSDIGTFGTGDTMLDIDAYGIRAYEPTAAIGGFQVIQAETFVENGVDLENKYVQINNLRTNIEIENNEDVEGLFDIHFTFVKDV